MAQRHDQKQFLDLLQTYKSDDTKKARRNLSIIGFLIIAAWVLGIRLTELKVFGVNLRDSSEAYILAIAFLLLIYWGCMFFLSYRHDTEIQKEREIQLNVVVERIYNRWNVISKSVKDAQDKGLGHSPDNNHRHPLIGK
jgi:hypothetical protein